MVLFISGRTDILSYYPKWLINRVREGFVDTRNPFNKQLVSRLYFSDADIILFCSKNPRPFLPYLDELDERLKGVPLVFHITLTAYHEDIEPVTGLIKKEAIEDIKNLSRRYGKDRIFVRYDPILLNPRYTLEYHIRAFEKLAKLLKGYTSHVVISFIDIYKNVRHNASLLKLKDIDDKDIDEIGQSFSKIARDNELEIFTCAEKRNLREYGFSAGGCLSKSYATSLLEATDKEIKLKKQTARKDTYCDCVQMADIGAYNTCLSRCLYCYANYDERNIDNNVKEHDDDSSLLIGHVQENDIIKVRK